MNESIIKEKIDTEIENILYENWSFLDKSYKKINKKYYHRTELKDIKGIENIKSKVFDRLGYIPVFFFLNELFANRDYKCGAYKYADKGILLLYQILYGVSLRDMGKIIPYSSYYDIYKDFWLSDYSNIMNKKLDHMFESMFSNIKLRIMSSRLYNPIPFKHVTILLDGHDSRIEYQNINIHKKELYSFKFKKPGINIKMIVTNIIYISNSKFCKSNVDGEMFLKMKIENIVEKEDCMAFDGGYYYYIDKILEEYTDYNRQNFIYPYRKCKNVILTDEKKEFNRMFGSYRSKIKTVFADIGNKFSKFDNTKTVTKTTNIKGFSLQFKVACLLTNIQRFVGKNNIEINEHNKLWLSNEFDYMYKNTSDEDNVDYEEIYYNENYKEIEDIQTQLLELSVGESSLSNKKKKTNKLKPVIFIECMDEDK